MNKSYDLTFTIKRKRPNKLPRDVIRQTATELQNYLYSLPIEDLLAQLNNAGCKTPPLAAIKRLIIKTAADDLRTMRKKALGSSGRLKAIQQTHHSVKQLTY